MPSLAALGGIAWRLQLSPTPVAADSSPGVLPFSSFKATID